ncbi:MAG: DUF5062 family protein [Gammaproteobacteria bacterium]|nr:DUF5062 family protein [Gammaproteobacteria bacterium]
MKKHKNEDKLFKLAMELGGGYAKKRGFSDFDKGVSNKDKVECIYRLLVSDKLIKPLPEDKEDGPNIKHRLVLWIVSQLPETHALLK